MGSTYQGGYAAELPAETLMAQRYANDYSTQNDMARLYGARLALTDEGDKHRELNTDLVKKLTGGGMLVGKFMHKDKFDLRRRRSWLLCVITNRALKWTTPQCAAYT